METFGCPRCIAPRDKCSSSHHRPRRRQFGHRNSRIQRAHPIKLNLSKGALCEHGAPLFCAHNSKRIRNELDVLFPHHVKHPMADSKGKPAVPSILHGFHHKKRPTSVGLFLCGQIDSHSHRSLPMVMGSNWRANLANHTL